MQAAVKNITAYLEEIAPSAYALPGDPVGLQLGHPEAKVKNVLVALDPDESALNEAQSVGADMLITHHPLFYERLASLDESLPAGALIAAAVRNGLHIFSAHSNYDTAPRGVSYQLALALGLPADAGRVVEVTGSEQFLKLVVFVPAGHEDDIRGALAAAGAGQIGNYSHCTFQTPGIGTFMPGEGTGPFIGSLNKLEKVEELRLETILPSFRKRAVIEALLEAHPYEEVAYDLYPLALEGSKIGLGLSFTVDKPLSLDQILQNCRRSLNSDSLRYWTPGKDTFMRVALCGGSGGTLIEQAARQGSEILISGDFRYHDLKSAQALGLALVDAGHAATEWPGMAFIKHYLAERLQADGYETGVQLQASVSPGWR